MMRKKKHPLTLVEIVVALSLLGLVLSFLWQALFGVQKMMIKVNKSGAYSLDKALFYTKISHILVALSKDQPCLYTENHEGGIQLIMNGMKTHEMNKEFCGTLKTILSLNNQHIQLAHFSSDESQSIQDLFFSNIQFLSLSFFDDTSLCWVDSWPQEKKQTPSMLSISYGDSLEEKEELLFHIDAEAKPIIYPSQNP